jgi:hypothetical protein
VSLTELSACLSSDTITGTRSITLIRMPVEIRVRLGLMTQQEIKCLSLSGRVVPVVPPHHGVNLKFKQLRIPHLRTRLATTVAIALLLAS